MSLNDSSAIILIIGAIAVIGFVIHGLWFSGKSVNRKLAKNNAEDQKIISSEGVGKVRIVTTEMPSQDTPASFENYGGKQAKAPAKDPVIQSSGEEIIAPAPKATMSSTYELNLVAEEDKPFQGDDIQEIFDKYSCIRSENNIFIVYEDNTTRDKIVFRICSLKEPFSFPTEMGTYETPAIALYMNLPQKGKAYKYFGAMRFAAQTFVERLGGHIQDNNYKVLTPTMLDGIAQSLKAYDVSED